MSKYTKLQTMLARTLDTGPEDKEISAVIDCVATWFEIVSENVGIQPSSIPTLLRWQYLQGEYVDE
jgi:hypothetical protein